MAAYEDDSFYNPITRYQALTATAGDTLSMPSTIVHGAVATVADIGTTLWNSLTPEKMEVSTSEVLDRIDRDALQVYNENPETIKALSFFGGMLAPVGVSMKAMGWLRNGAKGTSWFSTAGQSARIAEAEKAFQMAGYSDEFYKASWAVYRGIGANAVADSVAAELAIVGAMSAHPYMDDYYKDFGRNFAIGVTFGGVIGTGFGAIGGKRAINQAIAPTQKEASERLTQIFVKDKLDAGITEASMIGEQVAFEVQAIQNLKDLVTRSKAKFGGFELSPYTEQLFETQARNKSAQLLDKVIDASTGELKEFLEAEGQAVNKQFVLDFLSKTENAGLDKVSWLRVTEPEEFAKPGILQRTVDLFKITLKDDKEKLIKQDAFYTPLFGGRYFSKSDSVHYATVADLGTSVEALAKSADKNFGKAIRQDMASELAILHSAKVDAEYARAILAVEGKDLKALGQLNIGYDDLPLLMASLSRAQKLEAEGIDFVGSGLRIDGKAVADLAELEVAAYQSLVGQVRALQGMDMGMEAISIRAGTNVETVQKILQQQPVQMGEAIKYANKAAIEEAVQVEKRAFGLSTNMNKIPDAERFSKMHSMNLDQTASGFARYAILSSPSKLVQDIGEKVFSDDFRAMVRNIQENIADVIPASAKSTFFSSADHALSAMGQVGQTLSVIGKEVIGMRNAFKEAIEKELSAPLAIIAKDPVALIEWNTAVNLNAALSGQRWYKAGKFWQFQSTVSKREIQELLKLGDDEFRAAIEAAPVDKPIAISAALPDGREFEMSVPAVREAFEKMQEYGRHIYDLKNARNKSVGAQELSDLGLWIPPVDPSTKEIAYVYDRRTNIITMLYARNPEELAGGIARYKQTLENTIGSDWSKQIDIVEKGGNQAYYNKLAGRHDPMMMEIADVTLRHGGASSSALVSTNTEVMQEILGGYGSHVGRGIDDLVSLQVSPLLDHFKTLSDIANANYNPAKTSSVFRLKNKPVDVGAVAANVMLGRSNLSQSPVWNEIQQRGQVFTDRMLEEISNIFSPVLQGLGGNKLRKAADWDEIVKEMERRGVINPFESLDRAAGVGKYLADSHPAKNAMTARTISLGNGLAATVMLRLMDMAQPLVNAISLPILTSAAVNKKMLSSFYGQALDENAKFTVQSVMHDAVRLWMHPTEGARIGAIGASRNLFSPELRQVTELLEHTKSLDPGLLAKGEAMLESQFVKWLSWGADKSENLVRQMAFYSGWTIAKRGYPGISDTGAMVFARNFMDESIGNYTSAQRPAFFQGTFGTAMGLFQTYMLTMAQAMYKQVEAKNWAALGKMLLTQNSIFGMTSLPGFKLVSETIGSNYSDSHVDLETGVIRAVSDPVANVLLYGVPSSFGPGITTRGDIQPRVPNPVQGLDSIAVYNITKQAFTAADRVARAAMSSDENAGRALLESLSMQSISRPVARWSELLSGKSLTGAGDIVANDTEIFTAQSIFSRVFATRPLSEIKAREAIQLNSLYHQVEGDRRKKIVREMKAGIRSGVLTDQRMDEMADEYMRTGNARGWRSAINEAIVQAGQPGSLTVRDKLGPDNILNVMIDQTE